MNQKNIGSTYMILSCLFFSLLAGLIKYIGNEIHAFQQAFFRNSLSILILLPFILFAKSNIFKTERVGLLILRSFFGALTMILLFLSYTLIPLNQAVTISFTTPLFIFLGGIFVFKEKVNYYQVSALFFGFCFIIMALSPKTGISIGSWVGLSAAIFHAIAGLIVKELTKTESVLKLMFFMVLLMSAFTFFPAFFYWEGPKNNFSWLLLFSLAILGTLGNFFWTSAISIANVTNIMPYDFTKLIFSALISFFCFNEKLDLQVAISGIGIILCNIVLFRKS